LISTRKLVGRNLTFFLELKLCKVSGVLLSLFVPLERLTRSLPSDTLGWFRPATTSAVAEELDLRCVALVAGGLISVTRKMVERECDVYLGLG
jgi:hypothetical protein